MAYKVDKFNGTFLVNVADGTIDTTTDLRFVGKNYAGYGEIQNENFLHLLENFANTTQPPRAVLGQIWYDSANKKLKFYDGSKFKFANGAETSATAPSGLAVGEFWWDSTNKQLYTWSGTDYILVGPTTTEELSASTVEAQTILDTNDNNRTILRMNIATEGGGSRTMAIVSRDAFTPKVAIPGYITIKKGITLFNTNSSGVSTDEHYYWGTSSDSARLGGLPPSSYLTNPPPPFTGLVRFADTGYTLGDDSDLRVQVQVGDEVIIENQNDNPITVRITNPISLIENNVAVFSKTDVSPGDDATYDLGTNGSRWNNIYSVNLRGNIIAADDTTAYNTLTKNFTGSFTGELRGNDQTVLVNAATKTIGYGAARLEGTLFGSLEGSCTGNSGNSARLAGFLPSITVTSGITEIPIRDNLGNIYANRFVGVIENAEKLLVGATYRSASVANDANTVAVRTSSGDLNAVFFNGTATAALYADLAEKYLTDKEYEPGTVVAVGGDAEVTASKLGQRAIGVVSTNPAFMMNKDLEGGTYIALKGRVPVKVFGRVNKGDELVAGHDGNAITGSEKVFAIALEHNDNPGVKLVEAVIL